MKRTKLIREQLNTRLQEIEPVRSLAVPSKGWIRAIRSALGMSARQLASRLKVAQQTVDRFEKSEMTGSVSIKTMRRVAESLDCVFVYALVPRESLERTMSQQAERYVRSKLSRAQHTMVLEDQSLSNEENARILEERIKEIADDPPKNLWESR